MSQNNQLEEFARRADQTEELTRKLQQQLEFLRVRLEKGRSIPNTNDINVVSGGANQQGSLSAEQIEDLLLEYIDDHKTADSRDFVLKYDLNSNAVYGAINSLSASEYVINETKSVSFQELTKEAKEMIENGSPEYRLYQLIPDSPSTISKNEVEKQLNKKIFKIGFSKCMQKKWIIFDKKQGSLQKNTQLKDSTTIITDSVAQQLRQINVNGVDSFDPKELNELKKRKLLKTQTHKYFNVIAGPNFSRKRVKPIAQVTAEHAQKYINPESGEWNGPALKKYNFDALGQKNDVGSLHPLMKMRHEMRNILLQMGFEEMPTNQFVESSFMNFDTLFQPQQHPARDAHDTFFLSKPSTADIEYPAYMERVKQVHTKGGYGSIGWRYDWQESEARKNLLRTHTTAVSSRMLYQLAQLKPFKPKKYFSIDRVFRNEAIDATHLAEFHQVEGFVADYDLTLGHLIGVIGEFFKKIGIENVKFKPAYNPYTEPSMEIFGYSKERDDWVEVGNSGIFRPEMLEPMGLPKDVKVIAWGLGLERPCMIATKVDDIRQLFGPRVDVNMVKKFPFVRYDK